MAGEYTDNNKPLSGVYSRIISVIKEIPKKDRYTPGGSNSSDGGPAPAGPTDSYFISPFQPS